MNRRQLFTRLAAIAVAPAVVPEAVKPALMMKTRSCGSTTFSAARWNEEARRAFIDRQHARIQARKSQQGRMNPQESKWLEHVILKPHPSCTLYPQAP